MYVLSLAYYTDVYITVHIQSLALTQTKKIMQMKQKAKSNYEVIAYVLT